jgi:hypothetical protein
MHLLGADSRLSILSSGGTVKATKATMTKLERLRDRYLSPDTLRKVREALATESMLAVPWY